MCTVHHVAGATLTELPPWAAELIEEARVAHLGLLDEDNRPRVQPVMFARVGEALYTAVDDKPKRRPGEQLARVRRLRERPHAALTVDRYDDDWTRLAWVQILGDATVMDTTGPRRRARRPHTPISGLPRHTAARAADTTSADTGSLVARQRLGSPLC